MAEKAGVWIAGGIMEMPSYIGNLTEKFDAGNFCGAGDEVGKIIKLIVGTEIVN